MSTFLLIVGIVLFCVGVVGYFLGKNLKIKLHKTYSSLIALGGVITIILSQSFVIIPTGYTGVKSYFGQISDKPISSGFNWKAPFVDKIEKVNNKQQDITIGDRIWGESSEKTVVYAENVVVSYQINPEKSAWICANVSDYSRNLISSPIVNSALKDSFVVLDTKDATIRSKVEPLAKENIQKSIDEKYGEDAVFVKKVVINNIDFEESYNEAISQKQIAKQNKEKQDIENATNVAKAEAEAKAKLIQADADAQAKIRAAEAEAEANKLKEKAISITTLTQDLIDKWNGELPRVISDGDKGFVFGMSEFLEE